MDDDATTTMGDDAVIDDGDRFLAVRLLVFLVLQLMQEDDGGL